MRIPCFFAWADSDAFRATIFGFLERLEFVWLSSQLFQLRALALSPLANHLYIGTTLSYTSLSVRLLIAFLDSCEHRHFAP